jgi:mono/diheme cytochrome c family protein
MSGVVFLLLLLLGCGGPSHETADVPSIDEPLNPPVRISMAALHAAGGVPEGWRLEPPKGSADRGRAAFERYGCHTCHVVQGESFSGGAPDAHSGPELTGMGRHHPPAYFVEAILSPSAVITSEADEPTTSERSAMPAYPEMPLADLTDLVAYLSSLKEGGTHDHAAMMAAAQELAAARAGRPRPAPPLGEATVFFVQRYDILPGELAAFEEWFATRGRADLMSFDGLVSIDTYVHDGESTSLTTVFGFRDQAAVGAFMNDPRTEKVGLEFDAFIGPHGHQVFVHPPLYRAPSLSTE